MHKSLAIIVVGAGNIGSYWLDHFADTLPDWAYVSGIYSSRRSLQFFNPTPLSQWQTKLLANTETSSQHIATQILDHVYALHVIAAETNTPTEVVVLDLTANGTVSKAYTQWIARGAHIISANKHAGASPQNHYLDLRKAFKQAQKLWFYNTTVGAALPIQKAIQERRQCNDQLNAIVGLCSGSLSWILTQYQSHQEPFSHWLQVAADEGLTEPDPRQDLNGQDVAKKLLILAREAGWSLSLSDIKVQSLVPPELVNVPLEVFWEQLPQVDAYVTEILAPFKQARVNYLSEVKRNGQGLIATASVAEVTDDSAFANLQAGDNAFQIHSQHYQNAPLTIQGPGAGRQVTAAGVHTDVLELIEQLTQRYRYER